VGYREEVIRARLNDMPIDEDVREILRHALLWIWKDEEMHAIYIRGALLKLGSPRLRFLAFAKQMAGAVGGWAGSVQQHVPSSQAPLSRTMAAFFTAAGALVGKVSRPVRRELRYRSFRDFCVFNIDAEKTASLCWRRIIEIAARLDRFPTTTVGELQRMQSD